jgi:tetratricopeptide (TPR) repeat protein
VVRLRLNPEVGTNELRDTAERAISAFEELGDEEGLARAWLRLSDVHWMASQWASRTEALEQALVHARRAGARRQEKWILGSLALSLTWGSAPFSEAIERCEKILAEVEGDRLLEARVLVMLAECKAPLGQFDEARELYRRSKELLEDLGLKLLPGLHTLTGGAIEMLAGAPDAAATELRSGYERLQSMGEKVSLATVAADLSEALYAQGLYEEADRFAEIAETTAPQEDVTSRVVAHGTQAKLLARRGDAKRAESIAREAVEQAARTDAINMHADALMNLAEVLHQTGREDEARAVFQEATELYERKGNLVSQKRAAALATGAASL